MGDKCIYKVLNINGQIDCYIVTDFSITSDKARELAKENGFKKHQVKGYLVPVICPDHDKKINELKEELLRQIDHTAERDIYRNKIIADQKKEIKDLEKYLKCNTDIAAKELAKSRTKELKLEERIQYLIDKNKDLEREIKE